MLLRLGASKYPDFTLAILAPMIKTISNPGKQAKGLVLYQACWTKTVPPPTNYSQILGDSNWYRVGKLYTDKLRAADQTAAADAVLEKLKHPPAN